jgi:hypothetical protein
LERLGYFFSVDKNACKDSGKKNQDKWQPGTNKTGKHFKAVVDRQSYYKEIHENHKTNKDYRSHKG